jgi:predicted RNA-binding Zn-ribbon protein involved in translation (DUF1610 family)
MTVLPPKAYVEMDGGAVVICPECGFEKLLSVDKLRYKNKQLKIQCKCGFQFNLFLECRKFYRKAIELNGECIIMPENEVEEEVKLSDLSMGGACFTIENPQRFSLESRGLLRFVLDDKNNTEVIKRFTIISVTANQVHCKFFNDKEYERELSFYLRP